jgi:putative peptidoglycan lipid II flippase
MILADESDGSRKVASSVLGFIIVLASLLTALGILFAPMLTRIVAPGVGVEGRALTTTLVRILFPMSGVMVLGAWCLGVLNSHGRFFLPFVAPTLWNLAQIAGLLLGARAGADPLVVVMAWSALVGAVLQVGVQIPSVRRLVGSVRPSSDWSWPPTRKVLRNAMPVISSQGIFQISGLIDVTLASLLGTGALAAMGYSQRLIYLPISLFGISVAAVALPAMSRDASSSGLRGLDPGDLLGPRLRSGFLQIAWFVFPSALILAVFGDLVVRVIFQRGAFGELSAALVEGVLIAYSVGLVAASNLKLFASGFHALQDTRTPMRIAIVSVAAGLAVAASLALYLRSIGFGPLSAAALALGSSVGSWLNLGLMWWALGRRIGPIFDRQAAIRVVRIGLGGVIAVGVGVLVREFLEPGLGADLPGTLVLLLAILGTGGAAYAAVAGLPPKD